MNEIRNKIVIISVGFAILISVALQVFLEIPAIDLPLKTGIVVTLISAYWGVFERYGWKNRFLNFGGWLCPHPNLNGRWEGTIDRMGEDNPHKFVLEVNQTFSKIQIYTWTKNSKGKSLVAQFVSDDLGSKYTLICTWTCTTVDKYNEKELDEFHGTSMFELTKFEEEKMILEDFYFTRRNPQTKGQTKLEFVSRKRLNSF